MTNKKIFVPIENFSKADVREKQKNIIKWNKS